MRILTVRQPWAWAIIHGGKDVENRVRNIAGSYRGPIAIHAGQTWDRDGGLDVRIQRAAFPGARRLDAGAMGFLGLGFERGSIIGVVDLVDVHEASDCWTAIARLDGSTHEEHCSPWAEDSDVHHLALANPRALDEPIPYKGALGLRNTDFEIVGDTLAAPWGHPNRACTPYGCEPGCELEPVAKLIPADITRMEQGT